MIGAYEQEAAILRRNNSFVAIFGSQELSTPTLSELSQAKCLFMT